MAEQVVVPPFDPEVRPVLDALGGLMPPVSAETLQALRSFDTDAAAGGALDLTFNGRVALEERIVPGPQGAPDVPLIILRPTRGRGPYPVIYNTHGGGMVMGSARTELPQYAKYVAEELAVVVAVEYRLAPEHPDPAPVDDCYAGLVWTAQHADEISGDPHHIMIVGASAGGGLAAGTALLARDRGFPNLTHQFLGCPMLDDRDETPSSRMLDGEGIWDRNDNAFGWTALLGDRRGGPDVSIYAAPGRATDLHGLPRTFIDVGSVETFRDEAILFAQRLSQAGVVVDFHLWGGAFHSSDIMAPEAEISISAQIVRDRFIRQALRSM